MLIVVSKTQKVVVVAGTGSATVHSNTIGNGDAVNVHFIPCTAGLKRYTVSAGRSNVQFPVFSVGVVGSLGMHGIAGFIDQFGDSITEGNRYAWGAVETFEVAHKLGRAGETFGVSGNNTLQLRDRLELFSWTRSAADVAVLAIGVNDAGPGWTDTQTGYYTTCINTLLAHGYGRVLCRHMLPTAANYAAINAGITAAAAACSDPSKVRVISTAGWPQFSLIQVDLDESGNPDGLHLSEPEYVAAVPYCVSAYTEALA
jgi:lysophospholipase L1-like esterase